MLSGAHCALRSPRLSEGCREGNLASVAGPGCGGSQPEVRLAAVGGSFRDGIQNGFPSGESNGEFMALRWRKSSVVGKCGSAGVPLDCASETDPQTANATTAREARGKLSAWRKNTRAGMVFIALKLGKFGSRWRGAAVGGRVGGSPVSRSRLGAPKPGDFSQDSARASIAAQRPTMGSTREARRAGSHAASSVIELTTMRAMLKVNGSR